MASNALDILTDDPNRQKSVWNDLYNPVVGATIGFIAVCAGNWGTRRPLFSGIQKHALGAAIGGGLGKYFDGKRNDHMAHRDAILRHYIELHPDDFPAPDRKKYSEVIHPWVPIR